MTAVVAASTFLFLPSYNTTTSRTDPRSKLNSQQQREGEVSLAKPWVQRQSSEDTAASDEESIDGGDGLPQQETQQQVTRRDSENQGNQPGSPFSSSPPFSNSPPDITLAVLDNRIAKTRSAQDIRKHYASKLGIRDPKKIPVMVSRWSSVEEILVMVVGGRPIITWSNGHWNDVMVVLSRLHRLI